MKRPMVILAALLLPLLEAPAQESPDTTAAARPQQQEVRGQQGGTAKRAFRGQKFIDEDGDGIADNIGGTPNARMRWGNDRFIDKDGDGICDDRASGLGFRRGKTGLRPGGTGSTGETGGRGKGPGGRR